MHASVCMCACVHVYGEEGGGGTIMIVLAGFAVCLHTGFQCPPLTASSGLSITYHPPGCNGENCIATYSCSDEGFTLASDTPNRTCVPGSGRGQGEWSGKELACSE